MGGFVGLIFYVALAILGSVIRKMAEEKRKQQRTLSGGSEQVDPYMVTLEDILEEPSVDDDVEIIFEGEAEPVFEEEIEQFKLRRPEERLVVPVKARPGSGGFDLVQAIKMSEVIRSPRASRPWPSR